MQETEIKLQVPAAQRAAVDAAVSGRARADRVRLQAAYFDTADRTLAAAGLALRARREGRRWVQTLKGGSDDGLTRFEHNVPLGAAAAVPAIAPALHAGTPVGDRLLALLAAVPDGALSTLYRTDILRRTRAMSAPQGRVELAFDSGSIRAGEAQLGVCELEIELLSGSAMAVLATARRWVPRFGLWLDTRSKAERGDLLARGETIAPPRLALPVRLTAEMGSQAALRAVLRSCVDQIVGNASQVASGEHGAEHVHQLRVGLRRLRSALSLFEGIAGAGVPGDAAAALFRRLGDARDAVVIDGEFSAELSAAMRHAGLPAEAPRLAPAMPDTSPNAALRETPSQMFLLDLLAALQPGPPADDPHDGAALRSQLSQRMNRWHRQLLADAEGFAALDDASRHRLRKRAKRLRYAAEFCGALFERRAVRRYLRSLRALQQRLGELSDVVMAMQAFARRSDSDPRAMFALGWLAARRELLIAAAAPELEAFAKSERFWKRG